MLFFNIAGEESGEAFAVLPVFKMGAALKILLNTANSNIDN